MSEERPATQLPHWPDRLYYEVRSLREQLDDHRRLLADKERAEGEIHVALATALEEREKIFSSKAWKLARLAQRILNVPAVILSGLSGRKPVEAPSQDTCPPGTPSEMQGPDPLSYQGWAASYDILSSEDRAAIAADIARHPDWPAFSLIMPGHDPDCPLRAKTIASLDRQIYPAWDLIEDASQPVTGAYILILEPGDCLAEQALYEIALAFAHDPAAALVYTDDDRIDAEGHRHDPVLKPDFSTELLLSYPLTDGLTAYRRSALDALAIQPRSLADREPRALALEIASRRGPSAIKHLASILCHRSGSEPRPAVALADLARRHGFAMVHPLPDHPQWNRLSRPLPATLPRVSVIIATRDRAELLLRCVLGLLYRTDYPDLEILILDNDSVDPTTLSLFALLRHDKRVSILRHSGPFNYSAINNAGARHATGEILLLLNNDIEVIDDGWLKEMVSHALRPDVGAVGAKLLYPDGRIQHAGVVLGVGRTADSPGIAGHFGHFMPATDAGYLGQFALTREVSAVTGACLALRKEVYETVGGLDEQHLPIAYNDVDLCLRIREAGYRIIWTPFAELYHLESATRGAPDPSDQANAETAYMRSRWGRILDSDPFYNHAFDRADHLFHIARRAPARPWRPATESSAR